MNPWRNGPFELGVEVIWVCAVTTNVVLAYVFKKYNLQPEVDMRTVDFVLAILLFACSMGCGMPAENPKAGESLSVITLPTDVVYNMTRDVKIGIESDFLVKMIKIVNEGKDAFEVKSLAFAIYAKEHEIFNLTHKGEELKSLFEKYVEKFEKMSYDFVEGIFLGTTGIVNVKKTTSSTAIKPGEEAGIINIPFRFYADGPATKCNIHFEFLQSGKTFAKDLSLQVTEYKQKNKYIFPVKDAWVAINTYNASYVHRVNSSQEFAIDLMVQKSDFMMYPPSGKNEDYGCWGKEVVASADGTVVDCANGVPNNPSYLGSRGLPIIFTNIKDFMNGKIDGITEPNMIVLAE